MNRKNRRTGRCPMGLLSGNPFDAAFNGSMICAFAGGPATMELTERIATAALIMAEVEGWPGTSWSEESAGFDSACTEVAGLVHGFLQGEEYENAVLSACRRQRCALAYPGPAATPEE